MRSNKTKIAILPFIEAASVFLAAFLFFSNFLAVPALAATTAPPRYAANELIRSTRLIQLGPGESLDFTVGFKNVGSQPWASSGDQAVVIHTEGRNSSAYHDESWLAADQVARLAEDVANPGALGRFQFTVRAPDEPGLYNEHFALIAGPGTPVSGGNFSIEVEVDNRFAKAGGSASGFKAAMLLVSERELNLTSGQTKEFRVAFKNVGRTIWKKQGNQPILLRAEKGTDAAAFRHSSWTQDIAAQLPTDEVKPGQLVFLNFSLTAPAGSGQFAPKFTLTAGDGLIEGGEIEIPVEVRLGQLPSQIDQFTTSEFAGAGPPGPNVRVGLFSGSEPVVVAADGAYAVYDYTDKLVRTISGVSTVTFDFNSYVYSIRSGGWNWSSPRHIRLTPLDPATIFEITSLQNRPTWDPTINFNRFRGSLEMMFSAKTDKFWTIEELPVEDYIRGLAETSNASPLEFQKALITAARTYALFIKSIGGKHASEYFDLNTTGNDQVYKGYVSELVRPNVVRAAEETRGVAVTYNRELVVTPYFSQSDGRTRAWTEVWSSSPHPWLISKPAPYDRGGPLLGHGVGMSANDAVGRARDGAGWADILKYYYNGVEISRLY